MLTRTAQICNLSRTRLYDNVKNKQARLHFQSRRQYSDEGIIAERSLPCAT